MPPQALPAELRRAVVQYLDSPELYSMALVNSDWSAWAFPRLYETARIGERGSALLLRTLLEKPVYRSFVKRLAFYYTTDDKNERYLQNNPANRNILDVYRNNSPHEVYEMFRQLFLNWDLTRLLEDAVKYFNICTFAAGLILLTPNITSLKINWISLSRDQWKHANTALTVAVQTLSRIEHVDLKMSTVGSCLINALLERPTLKGLNLEDSRYIEKGNLLIPPFHGSKEVYGRSMGLTELRLLDPTNISQFDIHSMIQRFPYLEHLYVDVGSVAYYGSFDYSAFVRTLECAKGRLKILGLNPPMAPGRPLVSFKDFTNITHLMFPFSLLDAGNVKGVFKDGSFLDRLPYSIKLIHITKVTYANMRYMEDPEGPFQWHALQQLPNLYRIRVRPPYCPVHVWNTDKIEKTIRDKYEGRDVHGLQRMPIIETWTRDYFHDSLGRRPGWCLCDT